MKRVGDVDSARFLSLQWKALIALSLILLLVTASLALLAYRQSVEQFENQQASVRKQQAKQFHALLGGGDQDMSNIAQLVSGLAESLGPAENSAENLRAVLDRHGTTFDFVWGIRPVRLITPDGASVFSWPDPTEVLPQGFIERVKEAPEEENVAQLLCRPDCRQYLAAPVLVHGRFSGTLVLSRDAAASLLTFQAVTEAEVAILTEPGLGREDTAGVRMLNGTGMAMPAVTHSDRTKHTEALLSEAVHRGLLTADSMAAVTVQDGEDWYEIFRDDSVAPKVHVVIFNGVTEQRKAIWEATINSIKIGIIGLLLSGALLYVVLRTPVTRIKGLVGVLPLLAKSRFKDIRSELPDRRTGLARRDEIDTMVDTVAQLTDTMESLDLKREEAVADLTWRSDHDPLTELLNRRGFGEEFERVLEEADGDGHTGALLFLDLDQFKDVNDHSGHQTGDKLLQLVAKQLYKLVRFSDPLGRLGGDEFALVLPESNAEHAVTVAKRVLQSIAEIDLPAHEYRLTARNHRHRVSASIGIVLFPEHGGDTRQLLANADLAMYQAKDKGRGRYHLFSNEDQAWKKVDARVVWTDQIDRALSATDRRFELYFQPIMEIATGKIRRAEALIRMRDVDGQLVFPDSFIPVAQKTGRIQSIDHWVLRRAIETMARKPGLNLSVNLSANAMEDETLLPDLQNLLDGHGIDANRLTLEITETAAVNSLLNATRLMRRIQDLGCRFALDDFGSGFASYAYLRRLPVNDVKIDGSFVRGLSRSREDRIFVKAISDVAHGVGKGVVAEFVENAEILEILAELGVEYAQGYHISRPVPEHELYI